MIGGVRDKENARDLLSAKDMSVNPFKDIFEVGLGLGDDPAWRNAGVEQLTMPPELRRPCPVLE